MGGGGGGGGTTPYFLFIILFLCNGICSIKIVLLHLQIAKKNIGSV